MGALLAEKTVLIVAKKLDALTAMKNLVADLGAAEVHVASSANMALSLMRMQPFDFSFIDHWLGDGEKNGSQVVEESIREGLKRAADSQVLILPEGSPGLPNDSLENFADSFFVHPIEQKSFHARIEKLVKLKQAVRPAEELVDQHENAKALQLIAQMLRKFPSLAPYLTRLQGRLMVLTEQYDEAAKLFGRVAADRGSSWAYMGLGICAYRLGNYADAMANFNLVLERSPESIEAFDWLSRIYRAIGRNREAQKLLEKAVKLQPTVPVLQSGLGDVASENSSWGVAIDAFRSAVKYARHSCHQEKNNYFGLARCLQTQVSKHGGP